MALDWPVPLTPKTLLLSHILGNLSEDHKVFF